MANISMTETALTCHPLSEAGFVSGIAVQADRHERGRLRIRYTLLGSIEHIHIPESAEPERMDNLWKDTCFEMFCRRSDEDNYFEYNFAPSGQWAAYCFTGYRERMAELACAPPHICCNKDAQSCEVTVDLQLPESLSEADVEVGLCAVIADKNGGISYWAIAHPTGEPDFHHKDCFALQLDARSAA